MSRFPYIFLLLICLTGQLLSQAIVISNDTYQYRYPVEYDQSISIDTIIIKETTSSVHFDASHPVTVELDFGGIFDTLNTLSFSSSDQADTLVDQSSVTYSGNKLIVYLTDTLGNNREIRISGVSFKGNGIASTGSIQLKSGSELIGESSQRIVFGDVSISMVEERFFTTTENKDTLKITLTEAADAILYQERKIYLRFNKGGVNWNVNSRDFGKISASAAYGEILTLTVDEKLEASESIDLELPVLPVSTNIYDVQIEASFIDSTTGFYDITANKFDFASVKIELTNSLAYIVGDSGLALPGLQLINDSKSDIFTEGTKFSIEIPAGLSWSFSNSIDTNGFNFTVNDSNNRILDVTCSSDHSADTTYIIDSLIVSARDTTSSGRILLRFDDIIYWESNTEIFIKEPYHKLAYDNVLLCQKGSQALSNISITQSTTSGQSIFRPGRTIRLELPEGLKWITVNTNVNVNDSILTNRKYLQLSFEDSVNDLTISNIQVSAETMSPQAITITYNENDTSFTSENTIRAGSFNSVQQVDTSFIVGDSSSVLPTATISQSDSSPPLLIPGYSMVLKTSDPLAFESSPTPNISPSNKINYLRDNDKQISLKPKQDMEISENINIDGLFVSNIATSGINQFIWGFQNDNTNELIPIDTVIVYVGNVSFEYVDVSNDEFRYPTYILGDSNVRKFPSIKILADEGKRLFRKNRKFTFELPEGITWNSNSYLQYSISNDQLEDTLIHDGLNVSNFSRVLESNRIVTLNNNENSWSVNGQTIKVVDPSITISGVNQSSQTFWLNPENDKAATWLIKDFILNNPKSNGYIPGFGIRLRITNTNDLEFIDKGQEIYYGSTQLSDVITTDTIIINDAGQIWNDDDISFSQIAVNVKEIFENAQIEFCLTEFPYYWKKCNFGLYANDPSVEIPRTAFLIGDSGLVFPDIDLNDFNHLPIDDNGPSLDILLPDGFPATWKDGTDGVIRKEFDTTDIGSSEIISELVIDKVTDLFFPLPLIVRSSEYQYAVDTAAAFRETRNTVKVGNPSVYFSSVDPGDKLKYRFCVNDPNFTIDTIKIAEDSVPAMLDGDIIYIKIEQEDFKASFVDSDIKLSPGLGLIGIEDSVILLKVTEDFTGDSVYNISGIQIGNFQNNVQKDYALKVYLRNPEEQGHPISNIASLQIGKPVIEFIDASMENEYYVSTEQANITLNSIISIKDDSLFPVIDTEGLLLKLENLDADSAIEWNAEYNNRAIWFQGSGIRNLFNNKVQISQDSLIISLKDTLMGNDVLRFKPFNFNLNHDGAARIKISNNNGASYLDTCIIYFSNPECKFSSGDQKILKFQEKDSFDDLIINSIYGLGDFIWIYLHDGLNCSWNNEAIDNIVITDKNGSSIYKKDATIILRSDAGRGNVLQLGLDSIYTSEIRKDSLIISNLPIEFHSIDPSSYDSLLVFWDDPSYKKLSVTCENRITIGSPTVELSDNVYLYSSDLGKQYILPNLIIQDDPIAQFITGSESVIVKIPEAMRNCIAFDESSNIKLYVENDTLIPNINPTDSLFVFEIPDSLALSKYNNKTMYLSGISCSVKESEQVPTSLKYYFNDFPFPDSKKIRIASPSVRFMGNYHNVIDQQGTTNLGENRLIIKEGTVPGLRKGKNINIELCSRKMKNEGIKGFLWKLCPNSQDFSKVDMKKEKLIVETNREFQGNDSTYFSDIKWTVNLDSLQSSTNLFDIFPESVSVCINFRPDEPSQPAWYESQNIIHVHLPVFYTDPSIAGNQLKFSAIKGFLNNKSDGINFKTSNTDPLFMRSRFNPDSLGIQYQMQNEVIDNLELFTITFNDSALFEMNRMFGEYLKAVDDGKYQKELWLGLDFPNIRLSGENGSDYFDWYKSQVSFTGYKPYNLAHVHETGWCFNQDNRFDLEISLDTNYIFTTDLINLCTGDTIIKPEISDSKEYTFIDTTSLYFNDEGLYIFKVNGISATDSCEMFPYTRYLLYDTTSPNLNRSSVRPRIVERHSERNRLSYTGLTISVFDTLRFAVYDNIKTDSSGFRMYLDSINNVVSIPYYFETGNQITIQTVFQDTSAGILSKTNQYYIKSKIDEKSTFRLFDEADQNLWVPVDSLVPDKIEGNLNVVIIIEDASGNISKDTLSYHLILSDGENDLLSQFVFNYPNPFSVYEGTKFRYVVTSDNLNRGKLVVIDGGGDVVYLKNLTPDVLTPGIHHEVVWDGRSIYGEKLASGIYFGYFEVENNTKKKVSYLKIAIDNR